MSVRAIAVVWDHSESVGSDRLVLLAIADSADHDGTNAWPGIDTIARKAKVSPRTAQRCVRNLEAAGELVVEQNMGGMVDHRPDRRPNRYAVTVGPLAQRGDTRDTAYASRGDTRDAPPGARGDTGGSHGVTPVVERGDTAVSPNPSLSVHEPSKSESAPDGAARPRRTLLPDGWTPKADHLLIAEDLGLDLERQADSFRDYQRARGRTRADWDAEFRRWLRSPYAHAPRTGTPTPAAASWRDQERAADEASRREFFDDLARQETDA